VTNASAPLLHAVYQYRTLLMRAYFRGDDLPAEERASLARLERSLAIPASPTEWLPRQFRRTNLTMPAGIADGATRHAARAANLSAGGVRLGGVTALPSYRLLTVRLDGARDYRFPARMVWFAREASSTFTMGLVFVGAPIELRRSASYRN